MGSKKIAVYASRPASVSSASVALFWLMSYVPDKLVASGVAHQGDLISQGHKCSSSDICLMAAFAASKGDVNCRREYSSNNKKRNLGALFSKGDFYQLLIIEISNG